MPVGAHKPLSCTCITSQAQSGEVRGAGSLADVEVEVLRCDADIDTMITGMPTTTRARVPEVREKRRVAWSPREGLAWRLKWKDMLE